MRGPALSAMLACCVLAACASTKEEPDSFKAIAVSYEVPVSCVPANLPAAPTGYADDDSAMKAAPDAAARHLLMGAGRVQRKQRLAELEPVIAICRKIAPPPTP